MRALPACTDFSNPFFPIPTCVYVCGHTRWAYAGLAFFPLFFFCSPFDTLDSFEAEENGKLGRSEERKKRLNGWLDLKKKHRDSANF